MRTILLACIFIISIPVCSAQPDTIKLKDSAEEKIWILEEAYFANLYKADYIGVLALVSEQFLGWPGGLPKPIDKAESSRFMQQMMPKPSKCSFRIEREGIRLLGAIALTQYLIYVDCPDSSGIHKKTSARITHTWVKEGLRWKLLGGMSSEK